MKKRKRAPGGGRKPEGEFRSLTVVKSMRMPPDLYDRLERTRQARGRSFNQELLNRLKESFDYDRIRSGDRSLRAFCFLFSELAQVICLNPEQAPDWRSDPWPFQAFKLAVAKLLDRFQPVGEMKLPKWWRFARESPSAVLSTKEEIERITESPEAMAEHAVQQVLRSFTNPQRLWAAYKGMKGMEEKLPPDVRPWANRLAQKWNTTFYSMDDAQRDLAPKLRRKK
jgi:Arc-like DNA binding domain